MSDQGSGRIDIISDAICPWCYVGKRQLERALPLLAAQGLAFEVHWHPYQLNPDMVPEGVDRAEYRRRKFGDPARTRQIDERVGEAFANVGLEFRPDRMLRTPNTVAAHRVIWLAGQRGVQDAALRGVQDAVVEALFRAYFTEGHDIGDAATLDAVSAAAGLTGVADFLAGEEGLDTVLGEDAAARRAGIDGVPCFTMEGHVLFSGAMPAETMAEAFTRAWNILRQRAA
jgi:predicted DsbA family dithiol-disulfide isomerase